jgi:cyclase
MIEAPSLARPWLLEGRHKETIASLAPVREFFPQDATVIPGQSRPISNSRCAIFADLIAP